MIDKDFVLKQVERYQKAMSQQERDNLLYQIGISLEIFTVRELNQLAEHGGISEDQRQRVLGYIEVYFSLDLGRN